jgi:hypothetical protein
MVRLSLKMVPFLLLALFLWCVESIPAGEPATEISGTVTMTATSVAAGIGWSWGSGMLTLVNGSEHRFKVSGLDVAAVGIKQATGVGKVYHLKNLGDFEGKYVRATAGAVVGGGAGATVMQNDKGVIITMTSVGEGVDFRLAVSGMDVSFVK